MKIFFSNLFLFLFLISKGQNIRSISFFNEYGILSNEETALYFRENPVTSNFYKSFYSNSKNKYFEGIILGANDSLDNKNLYQGICKWYYPNGMLKVLAEYNNGMLNGLKKEFNNDGKLIKSSEYENAKMKNNQYLEFDLNGNTINVFEEKFSNNLMNWPFETNEMTSSKLRIGGYELVNKSKKDFGVFCKKNIDSANFSIETLLNSNYLTSDTKSGIIFGFKDWNNYNFYYVSKFRFSAGFIKEGIKTYFFDNFFSYELKSNDFNNIKLLSYKDSLHFFINNIIQASVSNPNKLAQHAGLFINNGNVLFDDFYIKEYGRQFSYMNENNKMFYNINNNLIPVNQVNSGLMLGKNGYVLTSIKNIQQVNDFVIELQINDTIKIFKADIFYNSDIYKFTILKIKNYTNQENTNIEYNYSYLKNATTGVKTIICEYEKSECDSKFELIKINGEGKIISTHKHNYVGIYNTHCCVGSPIFDLTGNILGIISDVDKQNLLKIVPIQQVLGVLFSNPETNEIKHKVDFNISDFNNKINKNIVVVKTF
jgi:hypothetical protein